jgi:hypothetical protein
MENIFNLFRELRGGGWTVGRTTQKFFLEEWLAFVAQAIREHGWYSGRKAWEEGGTSTSTYAKRAILACADGLVPAPTDADYLKAAEAIEWVRDHGQDMSAGDFKDQLLAATASDDATIVEQTMGITAATFPCMWRWERDQAKADAPTSEYIGAVKDKVTVDVTVTGLHESVGDYGPYTVVTMSTDEGNIVKWFASGMPGLSIKDKITLKGTVRKHEFDTYLKAKVTFLNRAKVVV